MIHFTLVAGVISSHGHNCWAISVIPAFTETQDGRQPHDGGAISTSAAEATHLTGAEISRKLPEKAMEKMVYQSEVFMCQYRREYGIINKIGRSLGFTSMICCNKHSITGSNRCFGVSLDICIMAWACRSSVENPGDFRVFQRCPIVQQIWTQFILDVPHCHV